MKKIVICRQFPSKISDIMTEKNNLNTLLWFTEHFLARWCHFISCDLKQCDQETRYKLIIFKIKQFIIKLNWHRFNDTFNQRHGKYSNGAVLKNDLIGILWHS